MVISSCPEDWGGSEELWFGAVLLLAQAGHRVYIYKTRVNPDHPRIKALREAGCLITDLYGLSPLPETWTSEKDWTLQTLHHALQTLYPHLTIIAQGANMDGMYFADLCRRYEKPYVIIAQKATDAHYPLDQERKIYQQAYQAATHAFFVSHHNLKLTRLQLALPLPNSTVVHNPVNVPFDQSATHPFPDLSGTVRLACVARLFIMEKGQDVLLEVLASDKWRQRDWQLTFYGSGPHKETLAEMIRFLNLTDKVHFAGHVASPATIWETNHALVLPSRSEGLPLALVEAMLCERPAIAADAGGIGEILVDNVTGFLAPASVPADLDDALERAWNRRAEWIEIGKEAGRHVRANVPADPIRIFADELLKAVPAGDPTQDVQPAKAGQPLVSIIIPTYNRAHLINRAIQSVRSQTHTNWQLIVVDDGSTDGTRELLAGADDIEYYYQENKGQGGARNHGLQYCRGEYIISLDSDDEWYPSFLADSVAIIEKHDLDFVFSGHTNDKGVDDMMYFFLLPAQQQRFFTQSDGDWWLLDPAQSRQLMIETCPTVSSATLIRRTTMPKEWNEAMKIADDWCLVLDMVLNKPCRIAFTLKPKWAKYVHDTNIYHSRNSVQVAQELGFHDETLLLARFRHLLTAAEKAIIRKRIAMYHYTYAFMTWKQSRSIVNIVSHLSMALGLAPAPVSRLFVTRGKRQLKKRLGR